MQLDEAILFDGVDFNQALPFLRSQSATLKRLTLNNVGHAMLQQLQLQRIQLRKLRHLHISTCEVFSLMEFGAFLSDHSESLEVLALRDSVGFESLPLPSAMAKLHTVFLGSHTPSEMLGYSYEDDCHLFKHCPNLVRLFAMDANQNGPILPVLATHCPRLQQLHIAFSDQCDSAAVAERLITLLQGCTELRVVEFTTAFPITADQTASVTPHCHGLTAFRVNKIDPACLSLLLPDLRAVQHLALDGLGGNGGAPLLSLSEHCRHLRSLSLGYWAIQAPTESVVTLCQNLTNVEELQLFLRVPGWITDDVLRTIGTARTVSACAGSA
jgi:hypothetical protein